MTEFTPLQSLLGGAMIGVAAVALMVLHGRIAGITGILVGALRPATPADRWWRVAFLAGMAAALPMWRALGGRMVELNVTGSVPLLLASGVIVGIGVTLGGGCTSGHGVCGLARLSPRSVAATLTFMATMAATVFVIRHVLGG